MARKASSNRVINIGIDLRVPLEAFHGRGANDVFASHDLEDVVTLVDGRPTGRLDYRRY